MKRLHLLEIHEQPWCPPAVRDGATDCLAILAAVLQQYRNVTPLLAAALQSAGTHTIVDLCSGGAGPWRALAPRLQRYRHGQPLQVVLTDLYPSRQSEEMAAGGRAAEPGAQGDWSIAYVPFPVDATQVSPSLQGFRTLFTAFHHFPPDVAQAILQSAVDERQGIGIFEQTRRHPLAIALMLTLPFLAWLLTPLIRPWRPSRFFWTYVVPAIPAVLCLDGIVSCLRTYGPKELQRMASQLHGTGYVWQAGRVRSPLSPIGVTYLIGTPRKPE